MHINTISVYIFVFKSSQGVGRDPSFARWNGGMNRNVKSQNPWPCSPTSKVYKVETFHKDRIRNAKKEVLPLAQKGSIPALCPLPGPPADFAGQRVDQVGNHLLNGFNQTCLIISSRPSHKFFPVMLTS